ncbi:class II aldolase/adducin family protein [Xylanimonas protaetiae]|uniref:Aldolase n=1 Tax=Xylanimonas protaetiae TaxID=2509457 RepID=A0A4P6F6N5_9MICO|nr:class II aldolase/adducin family protein [Xylanimonas protaetiae]QAY71660.1 aldolase [Xylanimonas protaetiae]
MRPLDPATRDLLANSLCDVGRRAVAMNLSPGASGNLSVRDGATMLMTPSGVGLGELSPARLAALDARSGEPAKQQPGVRPSKEVPLHTALYRRFPEAAAVVHLHSPQAVAYACKQPWSSVSAIPPLTPYLVMRVGRVPLAPYGTPGTDRLAASLDEVPGQFRAVLLAHHGLLAWGTTLDGALDAAVEVEEAARTALLAGPDAQPLPTPEVTALAQQYGTTW